MPGKKKEIKAAPAKFHQIYHPVRFYAVCFHSTLTIYQSNAQDEDDKQDHQKANPSQK